MQVPRSMACQMRALRGPGAFQFFLNILRLSQPYLEPNSKAEMRTEWIRTTATSRHQSNGGPHRQLIPRSPAEGTVSYEAVRWFPPLYFSYGCMRMHSIYTCIPRLNQPREPQAEEPPCARSTAVRMRQDCWHRPSSQPSPSEVFKAILNSCPTWRNVFKATNHILPSK